MHGVVVSVTIHDREQAQAELRDQVVPAVSSAPGFVAGYWVAASEDQGRSIAVFESEEAAQQVASRVQATDRSGVTIDSVEVGEVVAHA